MNPVLGSWPIHSHISTDSIRGGLSLSPRRSSFLSLVFPLPSYYTHRRVILYLIVTYSKLERQTHSFPYCVHSQGTFSQLSNKQKTRKICSKLQFLSSFLTLLQEVGRGRNDNHFPKPWKGKVTQKVATLHFHHCLSITRIRLCCLPGSRGTEWGLSENRHSLSQLHSSRQLQGQFSSSIN